MSVIYSSDLGFYISHEKFIQQCYNNVSDQDTIESFTLTPSIFKINNQFAACNVKNRSKKRKSNDFNELNAALQEEVRRILASDCYFVFVLCILYLDRHSSETI